jgi:hypothetical protein
VPTGASLNGSTDLPLQAAEVPMTAAMDRLATAATIHGYFFMLISHQKLIDRND